MLHTPLQVLIVAITGRINEQQLVVIEYLKEENLVQRNLFGTNRLQQSKTSAGGEGQGVGTQALARSRVRRGARHDPGVGAGRDQQPGIGRSKRMSTPKYGSPGRESVRRTAKAEDRCDSVTVGGLAADLSCPIRGIM